MLYHDDTFVISGTCIFQLLYEILPRFIIYMLLLLRLSGQVDFQHLLVFFIVSKDISLYIARSISLIMFMFVLRTKRTPSHSSMNFIMTTPVLMLANSSKSPTPAPLLVIVLFCTTEMVFSVTIPRLLQHRRRARIATVSCIRYSNTPAMVFKMATRMVLH